MAPPAAYEGHAVVQVLRAMQSSKCGPALSVRCELPEGLRVPLGIQKLPMVLSAKFPGAAAIQPPPKHPHLADLEEWQLEEAWPRGEEPKAIFLDYDGTLREFEEQSHLATPTHNIQKLLAAMNERRDLAVHVISGRDAQFLRTHFGAYDRFTLVAEHDRRVAGRFQVSYLDPDEATQLHSARGGDVGDWQPRIRREITDAVNRAAGSRLEEKESSFVWHFRGVDEALGEAEAAALVERLESLRRDHLVPDVEISLGHKIVEVAYCKLSKGAVVQQICEQQAASGKPFVAGLVAGDDISDESMFQAVPPHFLTVKVGSPATSAKFHVDAPEELRNFLWRIIA